MTSLAPVSSSTHDSRCVLLKLQSEEGNQNVTKHVLRFLSPTDLAALAKTSRVWKATVDPSVWWKQCEDHWVNPKAVPEGIPYGQILRDLLYQPGAITPSIYREYVGDPGEVPPIPDEFVRRANLPDPHGAPGQLYKHNYRLVLIPKTIQITLPGNSPLIFKDGNLIYFPGIWSSATRVLEVPVTLNNLKLMDKGVKKGIFKPQKAARTKSRLTARLAK